MQKEIAYIYVLHDFEINFIKANKLEHFQIDHSNLTPTQIEERKALFQAKHYRFLKETAFVNTAFLSLVGELKFKTESESEKTIKTQLPPLTDDGQSVYHYDGNTLQLIEPALNLSYQELGVALTPVREYYSSEKIKLEEHFLNGLRHGPVTFYAENGNILSKSWFINGVRQGKTWQFYSTGALYSIQMYLDGHAHGPQIYYYPDGQLKTYLHYVQGQLQGDIVIYYPNGIKKKEMHFQNGKRQGIEKMWNDAGNLIMQAEYRENKPIGLAKNWNDKGILVQEVLYDVHSQRMASRQWDDLGQLIPEPGLEQEEYYESLAKQTNLLTLSLVNLYDKLSMFAPSAESKEEDSLELNQEFSALKQEIDHLKSTTSQLMFESGLQGENPLEPIWKTPNSKRELQKQLEILTTSLKESIAYIQGLLKPKE